MTHPQTCPKCNQKTMPAIGPGSQATARCCQTCGHVEGLWPGADRIARFVSERIPCLGTANASPQISQANAGGKA